MKTYWLYYNNCVVDAVRLPVGSDNHTVIAHALNNYDNAPGINSHSRAAIYLATVK